MQRKQQERQECNDQEPHARQMLLSKGIELENAGMRLSYVVVDNSCLISTPPSKGLANPREKEQLLWTNSSDMHAVQPIRAKGLQ